MNENKLKAKLGQFDSEQLRSWLSWMFAFAVVIIFGVFLFYAFNFSGGLSDNNGKWGTFGDFFGGTLNPILSFMSLTALLLTVVLQSRQAEISLKALEVSSKELEETRNELNRAASAQEKTEKIQAKQSFEMTLFNLIELHHKLASSLKFNAKNTIENLDSKTQQKFNNSTLNRRAPFEGRLVFDGIVEFITHDCKNIPEIIIERYKTIQKTHNDVLGHYFRNLYQILKIIKNHNNESISDDEKKGYASILRSQLSTKELALLFLNCLDGVSDDGRFRNLLVEYKMLEHLPIRRMNHPFDNYFGIPGAFCVSKDMVLEYKEAKKIPKIDFDKYYGGAFGKNIGVPYDLKNELTSA